MTKDGTNLSNDIIVSNNSGSQGPKGQRERRRDWRTPQNNKPKEAMVNGTSG